MEVRIRRIVNGVVRRVVRRAAVIHRSRTIERVGRDGDGSRARAVATKGIVDQRVDVQRHVFHRGEAKVVDRIREVVDRVHRYRSHRLVAIAVRVTDLVGELIHAVVVGIRNIVYRVIRRVVRRAAVVDRSRTVGRRGHDGDGSRARAVAAEGIVVQHIDVHTR